MKNRADGSYTVEACFVMIVILTVLMGVICVGMMIHDTAVLEAIAARGLLDQGAEAEDLKRAGMKGTLLTEEVCYEKEGGEGRSTVRYQGTIDQPLPGFLNPILSAEKKKVSKELTCKTENSVRFLRICRALLQFREEGS